MLGLLESEEEMVTDYIILQGDPTYPLKDKVLEYLKKGYELQGGVCVSSNGRPYFYQAMVKRKDND